MEINSLSLVYILTNLGRRVLDFFWHWYVDGFLRASDWSLQALERLDKIFALRITFKNLFQPLYQDYTLIGYMWGFIFRSLRLFIGSVLYLSFFILSVVLFLIWALIPIYTLYQIFANF